MFICIRSSFQIPWFSSRCFLSHVENQTRQSCWRSLHPSSVFRSCARDIIRHGGFSNCVELTSCKTLLRGLHSRLASDGFFKLRVGRDSIRDLHSWRVFGIFDQDRFPDSFARRCECDLSLCRVAHPLRDLYKDAFLAAELSRIRPVLHPKWFPPIFVCSKHVSFGFLHIFWEVIYMLSLQKMPLIRRRGCATVFHDILVFLFDLT